jgi:DNA processing protein
VILERGTPAYPALLAQCVDAPALLRVRGGFAPQDEIAVAVVGTRNMTAYGERVARDLAGDLARAGVTVVSGLAHGVDETAHRAALDAGGRTVAVLGCGLASFGGSVSRRRLLERVAEHGAVVSEYDDGAPATTWSFPERNRIVAGLAMATVVVEAGAPSGALITAARALDYDRAVFAVPGSVYAAKCVGSNRLIAEGRARLCRGAADVLAEVGAMLPAVDLPRLPLSTVERSLVDALGGEARHVNELAHDVRRPVEEVAATLTLLELRDLVRCVGDGRFVARA